MPIKNIVQKKSVFLAGLEPATFRVWGGRDNHYTTETTRFLTLSFSWHILPPPLSITDIDLHGELSNYSVFVKN